MSVKEKKSMTRLQFLVYVKDLTEAAPLLRGSVELIRSLRDSLIGLRPACAEDLGLDPEEHAAKCDFADAAGLKEFVAYVKEMIERGRKVKSEAAVPTLRTFRGDTEEHNGFSYTAGSERARVGLYWDVQTGCWMVSGYVRLKNPVYVEKGLTKLGFETTRREEK